MARKMALESPAFIVLASLYFLAIAVGFGAEMPALAPQALLMVVLTLVVLGHLLNVYQLAGLLNRYPLGLFVIDLMLVAVLAWMFNLLAHPVVGGMGHFVPPWVNAREYTNFISGLPVLPAVTDSTVAEVQNLVRNSLFQFFTLGAVALILLVVWHVWMLNDKDVELPFFGSLYVLSWFVFGLAIAVGWCATRAFPQAPTYNWDLMYTWVNRLSWVALGATITFVALLVRKQAIYKERTRDSLKKDANSQGSSEDA